ncbi:MAG: hypothetical protein ACM3Q2_00005 [Syntrophothermus sp.]
MYSVDRHLLIIRPREPFLDWLKNIAPENQALTLSHLSHDNTAFMIPKHDMPEEDHRYIRSIFPDLFDMVLEEWVLDTDLWPADRTYEKFRDWFDLDIHSVLLDTSETEIQKEHYYS